MGGRTLAFRCRQYDGGAVSVQWPFVTPAANPLKREGFSISDAPLLDVRDLSVTFDTAAGPFRAVDGVSFHVEPREVLAIVGESGSGKSVSVLAVMGLLPWTATVAAERMAFEGTELRGLSARRRRAINGEGIGMIFQEPVSSLNPCYTVGDQIGETLKAHTDLGRRARRGRALDLLDRVGLPDPKAAARAYPHQLSGGQCQRAMIAMAIACEPRLLIADEPTTALDVTIQAQILDLLLELRDQTGMGMILITHDMGVVAETADRVMVQYQGRTMESANVLDLFESPQHDYTRALLAALPERATEGRLPTVSDIFEGIGT